MVVMNEESLTRFLERQLEAIGEVSGAIERLVAEQGIPKRTAEALACGLGLVPKRYQYNQGTLGGEGQKRLLQAKVMVVGLGGLGGHVVEQLCRCGAGRLVGVDGDQFDETNLNRQLLADLSSVGRNKTETARKRVTAVNDAVEFLDHTCRVEELPDSAYDEVDLIFDCMDQIPPRLYLQDTAERLGIPIVHGAIGGWYGQVAVVWPASHLLTNLYGTAREGIERDLGNPPFTPALTASLMVSEGIKILLGRSEKKNGVYFIDLLNNQWEFVPL
jgi:molybdopterin/thiamine biosynthesis adenylyltransferase